MLTIMSETLLCCIFRLQFPTVPELQHQHQSPERLLLQQNLLILLGCSLSALPSGHLPQDLTFTPPRADYLRSPVWTLLSGLHTGYDVKVLKCKNIFFNTRLAFSSWSSFPSSQMCDGVAVLLWYIWYKLYIYFFGFCFT